jgi:hypothetical protein
MRELNFTLRASLIWPEAGARAMGVRIDRP